VASLYGKAQGGGHRGKGKNVGGGKRFSNEGRRGKIGDKKKDDQLSHSKPNTFTFDGRAKRIKNKEKQKRLPTIREKLPKEKKNWLFFYWDCERGERAREKGIFLGVFFPQGRTKGE